MSLHQRSTVTHPLSHLLLQHNLICLFFFSNEATAAGTLPALDRVASDENLADWLTREELLEVVRDHFLFEDLLELSLDDLGLRSLLLCDEPLMDVLRGVE